MSVESKPALSASCRGITSSACFCCCRGGVDRAWVLLVRSAWGSMEGWVLPVPLSVRSIDQPIDQLDQPINQTINRKTLFPPFTYLGEGRHDGLLLPLDLLRRIAEVLRDLILFICLFVCLFV